MFFFQYNVFFDIDKIFDIIEIISCPAHIKLVLQCRFFLGTQENEHTSFCSQLVKGGICTLCQV